MTATAPIAVFAYNRPNHLRGTLRALIACEGFADAPVTVFCDGPRSPAEAEAVAAAREVAREVLGTAADLRLAAENRGLAHSIIAGVTEVVNRHGRIVVVEDDFDLAPIFLRYMNEALDRYAEDERVFQVSGYMYDVPQFAGRKTALVLPMTATWGCATWARAWSAFDANASGWQQISTNRLMRKRFNLGGVYDFATMLERQMAGKRDSWGIRWYWSVFKTDGCIVYPPVTLVDNIGFDGSGTHGGGRFRSFGNPNASESWPQSIVFPEGPALVDPQDFKTVTDTIWRQNGRWTGYAVDVIKRMLRY